MTDPTATESTQPEGETIASVLAGLKPMGDLSQFVIKDLGPDEEEAFFTILKDA